MQADQAPLSSLHSKVEPDSVAVKVNVAVLERCCCSDRS